MLVFSLARAPLSISQDATRAVNLLCCLSPGDKQRSAAVNSLSLHNNFTSICAELDAEQQLTQTSLRWRSGQGSFRFHSFGAYKSF